MKTIDTFGIIRDATLIGENTTSPDAADALARSLAHTVALSLSANEAQWLDIEKAILQIAVARRMLNELRVFKSNLRFQYAIESKPLADTLNPTECGLTDIATQGEALLKNTIDSLI